MIMLQLLTQDEDHATVTGWTITEQGMENIRKTMGKPDVDMVVPLTDDVMGAIDVAQDAMVSND